ncbi:hypothetical protein H0A58_09050 [Alcaligenaceae bacterium]|nr:hypothetical protein [Alcaligenaceae bacterium]
MTNRSVEDDLQKMLANIAEMTDSGTPGNDVLTQVLQCLTAFLARHGAVFSFENFPLPLGAEEVMASYALSDNGDHAPALLVNAVREEVNSVVHNHGTWAVIVGIAGAERHRIYRCVDDAAPNDLLVARLEFVRDVTLCAGQSLLLQENDFHSIHTDSSQTALQLHLYGRPIDRVSGRRIVDPQTGEFFYG